MARVLLCPECGEERPTMRGLYWHCRNEHGHSHDFAFETVAVADQTEPGNKEFDGDRYNGRYGAVAFEKLPSPNQRGIWEMDK